MATSPNVFTSQIGGGQHMVSREMHFRDLRSRGGRAGRRMVSWPGISVARLADDLHLVAHQRLESL